MPNLLRLLGEGLDLDFGELLGGYFWSAHRQDLHPLQTDSQPPGESGELHFHMGLAFLQADRLEEAIRNLNAACRCMGESLAARLALAVAYQEHGDMQTALDHLELASRTGAQAAPVLFAAGFCCEKLGRPTKAVDYYRDALDQNPGFTPARDRLVAVDLLQGDLDDAIEQYQSKRETEPEKSSIRTALAHLYYLNGLYAQAVGEFQTAIAMGPENWALNDEQVESLVADGLVNEAIERLHVLIGEQGPFADLYVRLGDLYGQVGRDAEAMRSYHAALDIQPGYLEAMVKVGAQHLVCNRLEEAGEAFHRAAELNDELLFNYVGMGIAQLADDRLHEAMNTFELAAALEPNSTLLITETARLQLRASQGRWSEQDPGRPAANTCTAGMDLDSEDFLGKQIIRHAEQVRRFPDLAELRYRYGLLLRFDGQTRQAHQQFVHAVRINPHYTQALVSLGLVLRQFDRIGEAVVTFKRAMDVDDGCIGLHYRVALLYSDGRALQEAFGEVDAACADSEQIRAGLALSLQNMGLMDPAAATWRSLCRMGQGEAD